MKKLAKISGVVLTAFTAMLMFGANGEAYIDPSVMTYVINCRTASFQQTAMRKNVSYILVLAAVVLLAMLV